MISRQKIGIPMKDHVKKKISMSLTGKRFPRKPIGIQGRNNIVAANKKRIGTKQTQEQKQKRKESLKKFYEHNISYHLGKPKSEEFKQRLSNTLRGVLHGPMSDLHRKAISRGRKGIMSKNHPRYKKVICADTLIFDSISQTAKHLNIERTKLYKHLYNKNEVADTELTNLNVRLY